ncbi:MAG: GntR family transcriptional regulator, partial [Victivallales bacterium]|nr:GntR family transcriptional regulator [Victivallales bacterium]
MRKTLQIRHYLIGEIYRAGTSSVKLPSVRELARKFSVAQCTVSAVTAELIRDGWLRSRRGLGIFTNPEKIADDAEAGLIGVLNGDGCLYYFNRDV